ncbi:hypothetical protein [Bradyrhizobium sp. WD16]|uniref:hypothetical protein n=1 Tax=Bradyrhizobium sp. WD16 TaxID=1521768 RepID=UPI0020A50EA1|nr:hypothetical protein [Bradyrhizobium sp. WD16]UTD27785.1 hypothetical protein DB459_13550 [Bradyrhizobium sp. WD16]
MAPTHKPPAPRIQPTGRPPGGGADGADESASSADDVDRMQRAPVAQRPFGGFRFERVLKRDEIGMNHHRALGYCLSMIFSENRGALFRIML